jgi:hypothetical protein
MPEKVSVSFVPSSSIPYSMDSDKTSKLCVTETLTSLEASIGELSLTDLSFLSLLEDARKLFSSGLDKIACTDCMKAAYTAARYVCPSR